MIYGLYSFSRLICLNLCNYSARPCKTLVLQEVLSQTVGARNLVLKNPRETLGDQLYLCLFFELVKCLTWTGMDAGFWSNSTIDVVATTMVFSQWLCFYLTAILQRSPLALQ